MAVPYHTHTFEIPQASKSDIEAGIRDDVVATPASLGSSATKDISYFATAGQGGSADTAVQSVNGKAGKNITLDKSDVGLSNLDNTSDVNKPISTPAQNALDLKADKNALGSAAYQAAASFATSAQGAKAETAVQSVNGKSGTSVSVTKADVGLGNADNTSDANKPISSATQSALNGKATSAQGAKADTAIQAPGGSLGQVLTKNSATDGDVAWQTVAAATAVSYAPQTLTSEQQEQARQNIDAFKQPTGSASQYLRGDGAAATLNKAAVGLSSVDNTSDLAKPISTATQVQLNNRIASDACSTAGFISQNANAPYMRHAGTNEVVSLTRKSDFDTLINTRLTDTRFDGYIELDVIIPATGALTGGGSSNGYVVTGNHTGLRSNNNRIMTVVLRQPQVYTPSGGWRALGTGW